MKNMDWDDIRLFVAVARAGGLSGAADAMGASAATLSRRMLTLERRLGRSLFLRRQTGYALTPDGQQLLAIARTMEAGSRSVDAWLEAEARRPVVRISAGTWTSAFLCENFARLWSPDDPFCIALHTTERRLDIAHREVDIGIRNQRPDAPGLAARRVGQVAYAAFRARQADATARNRWIALVAEEAQTRSTRWVMEQPGLEIVAWANSPRTLYDMLRVGIGATVLPCFAGDRDAMLERATPPIEALMQEQWLVMHDEGRQMPAVRCVLDRLAELLTDHMALQTGLRPLGAAPPAA